MKLLHLPPEDARWLARWLRQHAILAAFLLGAALLIRLDPFAPVDAEPTPPASLPAPLSAAEGSIEQPLPRGDGMARAVAPEGWRRTSRGWEHVSNWSLHRPLPEIIETQRRREPAWVQAVLARVRNVPPLLFAFVQIATVAVIFSAPWRDDRNIDSQTRGAI